MHDLEKEFAFCKKYMRELGIQIADDDKVRLAADGDVKGKLGLCVRNDSDGTYEIRTSEKFLDDRLPVSMLRENLMHELLHTKPRCMNHGKTFQKAARLVYEKSGGLYNLLSSVSDDFLENPEKGLGVTYTCECGAVDYFTPDDPGIQLVEGQEKGNYQYVCQFCRKKIEPKSRRKLTSEFWMQKRQIG